MTLYKEEAEIELKDLILLILDKKLFISIITSIAALISVIYALSLPNIYTSSSLLAPSSTDDAMNSQIRSFSGLAGLAGINLPQNSSKSQEAIQRIESYEFFLNHFLPNIKYQNLTAVDKWLPEKNIIIYDSNIFDTKSNEWVSEQKKPSYQMAFKKYRKAMVIYADIETGFVNLSMDHKSPFIAKEWVEIIINNINESMREIDKQDAQNAINYLSESTKFINILSIKEVISKLLENQMQTLMLTSSNKSYIFRTIDSPIASEEKARPSRALVCIIGTSLGFIISVLMVLGLHLIRPSIK